MPQQVIWARGVLPGGTHARECPCKGHCRVCFDDLNATAAMRRRVIANGLLTTEVAFGLGPRGRYCSASCRRIWWQPYQVRRRLRLRAFRRMAGR